MSYWTFNIIGVLITYCMVGQFLSPQIIEYDDTAVSNKQNVLFVLRGILIYCLCWIVVVTIHEISGNDYKLIIKATNQEVYKTLILLTIKLAVYYQLAILMPVNHYANRLIGILMLYALLNQNYLRDAFWYNLQSLTKRKMQFICSFTMNQCTSLSSVTGPLISVVFPEISWLSHLVRFLPIFCRFLQTLIVGTYDEYYNTVKYGLSLIAFCFSVLGLQQQAYYWSIFASLYSLYWDTFQDFKWKQRFIEKKNFRIDIPLIYLLLGALYNIFAQTYRIFFPVTQQTRGIIQIIRRVVWSMLRIEREHVFNFNKPPANNQKKNI